MTDASPLTVDRSGSLWTLTLDKAPVNALDLALIRGLVETMQAVASDASCRAVLIRSAREVFCAGADIKFMSTASERELAEFRTLVRIGFDAVETAGVPVVGATQGLALGGGFELLLACDFLVAPLHDEPLFGLPEVNLGLLPGGGGTQRLTRAVGKHRATELLLTGRRLSPVQASELGIVTTLAAAGEVDSTAQALATDLATGPTLAYRAIKRCIAAALGPDRNGGFDLEQAEAAALVDTSDARAAITAFVNHEPPSFEGR
jgi:enoyl-CoA hydratase/carnithine racemase